MRLVYSLVYTLLFVLLMPYFLISGLFKGKYLKSVCQRFGWIPVRSGESSCWIHAVSVGEFLAAKPLIRKIQNEFPALPVFISTTTITGQTLAKEFLPGRSFYFPFDWPWSVRRVLKAIRPKVILIMETEIWPNLLWEAKAQQIPTILVNGRLSDRSFFSYNLFARWFPRFDLCLMQSKEDARRMQELGASRVSVMGNLKFDFDPSPISPHLRSSLAAWKGSHLLWIAGSTMAGEERELLQLFQKLKSTHRLKLLLAPRHPQRFGEVARAIASLKLDFAERSKENFDGKDVLLLDSIGELAGCYEFADLVFIGGTFAANGGHNPIEPAYFGKAIVAGPHFENFQGVFAEFQKHGAIVVAQDLERAISELLADDAKRAKLEKAAKAIVESNAGATSIALKAIRGYMDAGLIMEPHQELSIR